MPPSHSENFCPRNGQLEAFDRAWGDAGVRGDRSALQTIDCLDEGQ
jgi:hypothetical protein